MLLSGYIILQQRINLVVFGPLDSRRLIVSGVAVTAAWVIPFPL